MFDPRGWSPQIAAILNITPNHLDRHPTMEAYIAAKAHILTEQGPGDVAVLNLDDAVTRQMGQEIADSRRRVVWFSLEPGRGVREGAFLRGRELVLRLAEREAVVCRAEEVKLIGRHNLANLLTACALAGAGRGAGGGNAPGSNDLCRGRAPSGTGPRTGRGAMV